VITSTGAIIAQGTQKIITRNLQLTAKNGNIGSTTQRVSAQLIQGFSPVAGGLNTNTVGYAAEASGSLYLDLSTKRLNTNPVNVVINKIFANNGEVDLTIGSSLDSSNSAIASTYNFAPTVGNLAIRARNNVTINAGTTATNLIGTVGSTNGGLLDVITGGNIDLGDVFGEIRVKRVISSNGSIKLSGRDFYITNNATIDSKQNVNLDVRGDLLLDATSTIRAITDVLINDQGISANTTNIKGWIYGSNLSIVGNANDSTVNIQRVAIPTFVFTGTGNDVVNVGSNQPLGNGSLSEILSNLTLNGAENFDTLNIDDAGNTGNTTGTVSAGSITGFGLPTGINISYSNFETLNLKLGSGADTVTVDGTHTGTTNIDTDGGDDIITVNNITGTTTVNSGSGTNQLFAEPSLLNAGLTFLDPNGAVPQPIGGGTGGGTTDPTNPTDPNDPFGSGGTGLPTLSFAELFGTGGVGLPNLSPSDLFGSGI
jgi:hypothetical protein